MAAFDGATLDRLIYTTATTTANWYNTQTQYLNPEWDRISQEYRRQAFIAMKPEEDEEVWIRIV